jgi:hypothetical protein
MTSQRDTDWKLSAKGNFWRSKDGKVLVVGKGKDADYWVMVDGGFLEDHFPYLEQAKSAAERRAR